MIEVRFLASPSFQMDEVFIEGLPGDRAAKLYCIVDAILFAMAEGRRLGEPVTVTGRQWKPVKPGYRNKRRSRRHVSR